MISEFRTVGTVHDHLEVKIIDASTGETVPPGVQGEICTRGYSVMRGYWDDEVKTHEAVDREGWMHTGDLGTMNADGYVNVAEELAKFRSPELGPELLMGQNLIVESAIPAVTVRKLTRRR